MSSGESEATLLVRGLDDEGPAVVVGDASTITVPRSTTISSSTPAGTAGSSPSRT